MTQYIAWLAFICILSVILNVYLSSSPTSMDYWYHINWMKTTHRIPIRNWYNQEGLYTLDYPPLQGYIHYLMGIIYSFIDPSTLYDTELNVEITITSFRKRAMRIVVLLNSVIFYYPAVICLVTCIYRKYSNTIKLFLIAILLNFPIFVAIENMGVQVNSPSIGFLLYSILFMFKGNYPLTAMFFGLSILSKQITIQCIIPIAFYIISNLRKDSERERRPVLFFFSQCAKLMLIGTATLIIIISPFLLYPETLMQMKTKIFPVQNTYIHNKVANLWFFLRDVIYKINDGEYRFIFFYICMAIILVTDFLTLPFMLRKPYSKKVFWSIFTICSMNSYFFGFLVHEKHLQYVNLGFIFNFVYFKNFFCSFALCVSYSLIWFTFNFKNTVQFYVLNVCYLPLVYFFQRVIPELSIQQSTNCVLKFYNFQIEKSALFLKIIFAQCVLFILVLNIAVFYFDTKFLIIDIGLSICFIFLLYVYSFFWSSLYVQVNKNQSAIPIQFFIYHIIVGFGVFQQIRKQVIYEELSN